MRPNTPSSRRRPTSPGASLRLGRRGRLRGGHGGGPHRGRRHAGRDPAAAGGGALGGIGRGLRRAVARGERDQAEHDRVLGRPDHRVGHRQPAADKAAHVQPGERRADRGRAAEHRARHAGRAVARQAAGGEPRGEAADMRARRDARELVERELARAGGDDGRAGPAAPEPPVQCEGRGAAEGAQAARRAEQRRGAEGGDVHRLSLPRSAGRARLVREQHRLDAVARAELGEHGCHLGARVGAVDLGVRAPAGDLREHGALALGQAVELRRRDRRRLRSRQRRDQPHRGLGVDQRVAAGERVDPVGELVGRRVLERDPARCRRARPRPGTPRGRTCSAAGRAPAARRARRSGAWRRCRRARACARPSARRRVAGARPRRRPGRAVGRLADDLEAGHRLERHPQAGADELEVVDEQDADAHDRLAAARSSGSRAATSNPPPAVARRDLAAVDAQPLAHPDQAVAGARELRARAAVAAVGDVDGERVVGPVEADVRRRAAGVLDRVGQRLLHDAVDGELGAGAERAPLAADLERDRQARGARALDELLEPVERRR